MSKVPESWSRWCFAKEDIPISNKCTSVIDIITSIFDKIQEIIITFFDSSSINYETGSIADDEVKPHVIMSHKSSAYIIDGTL